MTKIAEPDKFFICAGGWIYFVDATNRKLLEEPYRDQDVHDAIYDPLNNGILVADWSSISLIKSKLKVWSIRTGTDGIRNLELEGRVLRGLGEFDYNGSEREFTLNLETRKLKVGQRFIANIPQDKSKPWWRFW